MSADITLAAQKKELPWIWQCKLKKCQQIDFSLLNNDYLCTKIEMQILLIESSNHN